MSVRLKPHAPIYFRESAFTPWRRHFAWWPRLLEQGGRAWLRLTWRRRVLPPAWFVPPAPATGWFEYSDHKLSCWEDDDEEIERR